MPGMTTALCDIDMLYYIMQKMAEIMGYCLISQGMRCPVSFGCMFLVISDDQRTLAVSVVSMLILLYLVIVSCHNTLAKFMHRPSQRPRDRLENGRYKTIEVHSLLRHEEPNDLCKKIWNRYVCMLL